jgi:hypothetical protein
MRGAMLRAALNTEGDATDDRSFHLIGVSTDHGSRAAIFTEAIPTHTQSHYFRGLFRREGWEARAETQLRDRVPGVLLR